MSAKLYKELQSLRQMALAVVEEADRMLAERKKVRPVSTGTTKNTALTIEEKFLLKRKNTRLRQMSKNKKHIS